MTEEKQEHISIKFDLTPPKDVRQSIMNTIILLLRDITDIEEHQQWDDIDIAVLNNDIEKIKIELDNLKIK